MCFNVRAIIGGEDCIQAYYNVYGMASIHELNNADVKARGMMKSMWCLRTAVWGEVFTLDNTKTEC